MKTILVPTDFSETANNALHYAIEFTKSVKGKIILFHAYHVPLPTSEFPMIISSDEIKKENVVRIEKLKKKALKKSSGKMKIECMVKQGFATDEILNLIKEKKIDIIIMGTKGIGNFIKLIGNTVTSLLKKANCPVIIVPEKVRFRKFRKIVYACDYKKISNYSILEPLRRIAKIYDAEIMVFNVTAMRVCPATEQAIEGIRLNCWLRKVKHSYWFSENNDMVQAINDFVRKNRAAIIAMVRRKRSFTENIFHKSITKKMVFYSHTPILFLHE